MYTNHQPPYNHPLVDRSPNIAELRKTVTIHSTDRDTSKCLIVVNLKLHYQNQWIM